MPLQKLIRYFLSLLLLLLRNLHLAASADDQFTFDGFTGAKLTLDGTATVTPNGLLMLTDGTTQQKGHAFYPASLRFRNMANGTSVQSFSTAFVIGIVGEYVDLSSAGIAFVVSQSNDFSSALQSQYLGLANATSTGKASNHLFAVEFDTILNAEFHDINNNHVGIDLNGLVSVEAENAGYYDDATGAFKNLTLVSRKAMQAWVDFDGQTMQVNVTMAPLELVKPKKPLLSSIVNLSEVIGETAYVGFSSSTGVLSCYHYVLGWSFNMDGIARALNISKLPVLPVAYPKHRSDTVKIIVLPVAAAAFVLALATTIFIIRRRRLKYAELKEDWEVTFGPHRFSYKDLFRATNGFNDEQLLGIGGFGRVYKGVLPTSKAEVAVKKVSRESRQGIKEFVAEVVSIGQFGHRNLVKLLGYCRREGELLLVYDYMPNGSLDRYLYDRSRPALSWSHRYRIIRGVASGLLYLHEDWEQVVLHRDIKTSNVLLDAEMNGRLGDFGLARLYDHGANMHTTHVAGTVGYLAPELGHTGKASKASDVFAFGTFMLEVTCGRRPVVQDVDNGHRMLVDWVREHWRHGTITNTVDPQLHGDFVVDEVTSVLKLGLLCSHHLPSARPGMRQAMHCLDNSTLHAEQSSPNLSFEMLDLMQDPRFASFPMLSMTFGTMSDLSGGR